MAKRKSKSIEQPNWRPNFRITEALPDTKVIRTDFLLNFVFLVLAVIAFGYLFYQQVTISRLNDYISDVETRITALTASNNTALKQSAKFKTDSKLIEEVNLFMAAPVKPLDLLLLISQSKPKGMTLNSISFSPIIREEAKGRLKQKRLFYSLVIKATSQADTSEVTGIIDQFQEQLSESEILKPILEKSEQRNFSRDNLLGTFSIELAFELKGDRS